MKSDFEKLFGIIKGSNLAKGTHTVDYVLGKKNFNEKKRQ